MRTHLILIGLLWLGTCAYLGGASAITNPSFEIPGSGGVVFGGWDQFGITGSTSTAIHGNWAATVSGQNNGSNNVSGYWQQLVCSVNEQWRIAGSVLVSESMPLQGQSVALVNIEWRNSSGGMISYDSYAIADASSPVGEYLSFEQLSSAAPAGTVAMRLVLGVLQGQNDPIPQVSFDQITCYSTSFPTIDDVQWNDFPGGRTIEFSDRIWRVKGPGFYGPGPNNFSDSEQSVWVDDLERLHMTIRQIGGAWNSTEVTLVDPLGYGDYIFTTQGALDQLDTRTVLGLFLWQYNTYWDAADGWWNPYNEFDIEYSRWGSPDNQIGQFVAQPWDWPGNIFRYGASFGATEISSHAIRWLPDRVECRAWRGGTADESATSMISSWVYTGPHIPRPEQPRVHINLWYFGAAPSSTQEAILTRFSFVPPGGVVNVDDLSSPSASLDLQQNFPNPFNPRTRISFNLDSAAPVKLEVFDIRGRKIVSLVDGYRQAGSNHVDWDAANQPSGIYLYRLSTPQGSQTRKCILMK